MSDPADGAPALDAGGPEVRPSDTVVLDRDVRAPRRARDWLDGRYGPELGADTLDDACLVVSELVTNALRHGLGDVILRASIDDAGLLELAVSDSGPGEPHRLPVDPSRVGGVGLTIVDRLCSSWGVATFPGGKTVWATMETGAAP